MRRQDETNDHGMPIGPYRRAALVCEEYDPAAPEVAARVAELIRRQLPSVVVEHVGSTAVRGCAGKGIVDLMLVYPQSQLEPAKAALDRLGFERQTTRDPFPEDRPMRTGSIEHGGKVYRLHVHVISASSPEVAELRWFRDRLGEDGELRARYVATKRAIIASGTTDSIDYCDQKGPFVQRSLDQRI